jgi:hypothetical protein
MYCDIWSSNSYGHQKCQLLCHRQCAGLLHSSYSYAFSIICLGRLTKEFLSLLEWADNIKDITCHVGVAPRSHWHPLCSRGGHLVLPLGFQLVCYRF